MMVYQIKNMLDQSIFLKHGNCLIKSLVKKKQKFLFILFASFNFLVLKHLV